MPSYDGDCEAAALRGLWAVGIRSRGSDLALTKQAVPSCGAAPRRPVDHVELLEAAPGADRDARERALGEVHGHLGLVAHALVEALQECAAPGEHDAAVHDV